MEYSDKKIKANPPLLYSILNPETNSDSPSAKSKGARLVSAKKIINKIILINKLKKTNLKYCWNNKNFLILKLKIKIKKQQKNKIIQTS